MIRVFCDFDGTICPQDIGDQFFMKFAGDRAEHNFQRQLNGEITVQQGLGELCEAIPSIRRDEFLEFIDQFKIDPHFAEFVRFCQMKEIPLMILSDGIDAYMERVLSNAGLSRLPFFANHAEFLRVDGRDKILISFPHTDAECSTCGNCKRNHILNASADDDIIVYVGDGYSDRCPVKYADIVFAKQQLIGYCQERNITYFEFKHFGDVQAKMEDIVQRKRLRHRQEAAMARREVFMQG
ncbi:MAG: 2-hydroxy-3-keto-5-methylthiopentenyl-1-phosphate phosphatase [Ignavibacteriae bacterium]|nr:MAG: 2-hydroxy-3-keto-5-methylthiopentenyl-1-phosphate phosphatase [Ignavibacteriota bacterium]